MIIDVDHVQLAAPPGSQARLRAFYTDVLGMTEIPKPPPLAARGGCWFRAGTALLHLGIEKEGFRPAKRPTPACGSPRSRSTPPGCGRTERR